MNRFSGVASKLYLNSRTYLRLYKRMVQISLLAMLFVVTNGLLGCAGCNDNNDTAAPSVASGCTQDCTSNSNTQGYQFNGNDLFHNQLYGGGEYHREGPMDVPSLRANAAVTTVRLPSLLVSFPPPLYGLIQTVNYAQTLSSSGVYVTSSTPAPTATPEVLGVQRQGDCSFSLVGLTTTETSFPVSLPVTATGTATDNANFGAYLHAVASLPAQTAQFPLGCKGAQLGIASQSLVYLGQDSKSDQVFVDLVPTLGYAVVLLNPGSGTLSATPLPQAASLGLGSLSFNVADVNGDGINDLIAAEGFGSTVSANGVYVFLGHSDGTFANPVQYAAGPTPNGVTIDDVNGDGKLDLIVPNNGFGPGNIQVLLGNGDGTFKPAINGGTAENLATANFSVAIGDFNGDGKQDLVLNDGEVMLGKGDGSFAATIFTLPIILQGSVAGGVPVTGDFNHDGKLDIAMNIFSSSGGQSAQAGEVTIFLGKGDGTFTTGASYANISGSQHMAAEDFDGDGNLDLILGSGDNGVYSAGPNTDGVFQFLMGRGDGTFAGAPAYQSVAHNGLNPIAPAFAVGDFNGDGKPDILTDLVSGSNIQGMTLMAGDGQGSFTQGPAIQDYPLALVAADMNGDSHLDAVYAEYSSGNYGVYVALGNGDGTFQANTSEMLPSSGTINDVVVGDFNGDGKPDVMVTATASSSNAGAIYLFLGNGDGTLQAGVQVDTPPGAYGLAAGDFNHDGNLDFVLTNLGSMSSGNAGSVLVYLGKGGGAFNKPVNYTASMFPGSVAVADMNKDGNLDLIVASQNNAAISSSNPLGPNGTLNVLLGKGDGTFQTTLSSPLNDASYTNLAIADMNQDGIPDVVVGDNGSGNNNYTQILYGKGDGTFPTGNSLQMGRASTSVTAVDMNGDKRPDLMLVSGGPNNANLDIFLNQYSGKTISTLPASTTTLTVSPNPAVAGQTVTFTAQVTASSGSTVPTGTVNFMNGSTQLGTGTLDSSGHATFTTSSLAAGSYPVTAVYSGDTNFATSTSSSVTLLVNAQAVAVSTSTTLATSSATANAGQNVTFTATVSGPSGSTSAPTGTVTFLDGTTSLGTGTLNGSGVATYSTSTLSVGTHSITARYPGDTSFAASVSSAITETINAAPSFTLAAATGTLSVMPGQSGTDTLTVTPVSGFNQAVSFACSGLPSGATCSFSPATVTPNGSAASTTTMTIATTAATSRNSMPWPFAGSGITLALSLFFIRRKKRLPLFLCLALLLGVGGMVVGCGGGSASPKNGGTPAGNSTVTVTALSGSGASALTQTATVTLTVQ